MMNSDNFDNLWNFLGSWFPDADLEGFDDTQVVRNFIATGNQQEIECVRREARQFLTYEELPVEKVSAEANRHFDSQEACRRWLTEIVHQLDKAN